MGLSNSNNISTVSSDSKSKKNQFTYENRRKLQEYVDNIDYEQFVKDDQGNSDPRWSVVIENFKQANQQADKLYLARIFQGISSITQQCKKREADGCQSYKTCMSKVQEPINSEFEVPFYSSQLKVFKLANLCLLRGQSQSQCQEEVRKFNNKGFEEAIATLKQIRQEM